MSEPIRIERHLEVPPEAVWAAWTETERLTEWLCAAATVDVRVGGRYELFWEPDRPEHNSTLGCRIREVDFPSRLHFDWRGPDEHAEAMNYEPFPTHVTITIAPDGEGSRMVLEHDGWGDGEAWDAARTWHLHVWTAAIDGLVSQSSASSAQESV